MIALIPRENPSKLWTIVAPILAFLCTLLLAAVVFSFLDISSIKGVYSFFILPFADLYNISDILLKASPLLIIALGLSVCFRANVWNVGAEGQFILGVIASSLVALIFYGQSHWYVLPLMVFAGTAAGMLWAFIPAILKVKFHTNEILVSLMLVYVAKPILAWLVNGPIKDPDGVGFAESRWFGEYVSLPTFGSSLQVNISVLFALLLALFVYFLLTQTFMGFQIKVSGLTPPAAGYAGFSYRRTIIFSLVFAGGCAGFAGAMEAAGPLGQLTTTGPIQNFGFTAIIVAFLGRLHPTSMIIAALFMASTYVGATNLQVDFGLPKSTAEVFQGAVLFLILGCDVLIRYRLTWLRAPRTSLKETR